MNKKSNSSWLKTTLIAVGVIVGGWYFFIRPEEHFIGFTDARKYWSKDSSFDRVVYCGTDKFCSNDDVFRSSVRKVTLLKTQEGGENPLYTFSIDIGGSPVMFEGRCDKSATTLFERRCTGTSIGEYGDEAMWLIYPSK